jgi:hypothetical protein
MAMRFWRSFASGWWCGWGCGMVFDGGRREV